MNDDFSFPGILFYFLKQPSQSNHSCIYRGNHVMQVMWQSEYNSAKSELSKLTDECSLEYAWGCSRWMITLSGIWSPCNLHMRHKGLLAKSPTKLMTSSNNGKQWIISQNWRERYFRITSIDSPAIGIA